jgi:hypothetical protein
MDLQGACEGGNRGQQALLQSDKGELGKRRLMGRQRRNPLHAEGAIFGQLPGKQQFRRVAGQPLQNDRLDLAGRKGMAQPAQIGLEPSHHDGLKVFRPHLDAASEPLGIEHLQQGRE